MRHVFDAKTRSRVMRRVKGRGTGPELKVRAALRVHGARYRINWSDLPGSPDIAMPARGIAIFVHGCFWHGHECPRGARVPKTNRDYWLAKIARNRVRDAEAAQALDRAGWHVETLWECDLKSREALEQRIGALLAQAPPRARRKSLAPVSGPISAATDPLQPPRAGPSSSLT